MHGVAALWGFYFAYTPNQTDEEVRKSKLSQDLILASRELDLAIDSAIHGPEVAEHQVAVAEHYFYTLYLARVLVLSRFLHTIPRECDARHACVEWATFQYDPPCNSYGDDVFAIVYRHVLNARASTADLKRTAEARFNSLVRRNERLFSKEHLNPALGRLPFYLAVDEIEASVHQRPTSRRRPACSRLGVSALFYGMDTR